MLRYFVVVIAYVCLFGGCRLLCDSVFWFVVVCTVCTCWFVVALRLVSGDFVLVLCSIALVCVI